MPYLSEETREVLFVSSRAWSPSGTFTIWRAQACLDADCVEPTVPCASPGVRSPDGRHCYFDATGNTVWATAKGACEGFATAGQVGHLVTVASTEERPWW